MVAAGRALRLGYFDHPPLAWWLSAGFARLAGSEAGWVVRLPFLALFACSTWLMFRLGEALFGARAGMWAAVALNLAPVFGIAAGGWVLPDGPLDFFLLAAALGFVRAVQGAGWRWWLLAGAAAGFSLLSKYSAALVLGGALAYLLTQPAHRAWLRRPQPYLAAALACAIFAPVLVWNARHGWVSFAFQGGRAGAEHFRPFGPLAVLGGEALFVLPWLWLPLMVGLARGFRAGPSAWRTWLPACLGVGAGRAVRRRGALVEARAVPLGGARLPDAVSAARRRDRASGRRAPGAGAAHAGRHAGAVRARARDPGRGIPVLSHSRRGGPVGAAGAHGDAGAGLDGAEGCARRARPAAAGAAGRRAGVAGHRQDRFRAGRRGDGDLPERRCAPVRLLSRHRRPSRRERGDRGHEAGDGGGVGAAGRGVRRARTAGRRGRDAGRVGPRRAAGRLAFSRSRPPPTCRSGRKLR